MQMERKVVANLYLIVAHSFKYPLEHLGTQFSLRERYGRQGAETKSKWWKQKS